MIKSRDVIGKSILSQSDGERVDSVEDLIISKDSSRIVAVLVDKGGLFGKARVVPIERVVGFGKDVVIITGKDAIIAVDEHPEVKEILDHPYKLGNKKVFTNDGNEFSTIRDLFFDAETGRIQGLELSGGQLEDKVKAYLPMEDVISIGPDAVIIRSEAVPRLMAQPGPVNGEQ